MLIAMGPGIDSIQDYTQFIDYRSITIKQVQGDTLDTCDFVIHDPTCDFTVCAEDDVLVLDETDPNGWPTVNLLSNAGFEGIFAGGVGTNWSIGSQPSGCTFVNHTANPVHGLHAEQYSMVNVASGQQPEIYQTVYLGADEGGNPIISPNYMLSGWVRVDSAWVGTGSGPIANIDWFDVNGSFISNSHLSIPFWAGDAGTWFRFALSVTAPSTANSVNIRLSFFVGANGITGSCYWDSIQFELMTFTTFNLSAPNAPVRNSVMSSSAGGNFVDEWWNSGTATGVTFATVSSPVISGNRSQQISIANMANGTQAYIYQGQAGGFEVQVNRNTQYTARMLYQVTTQLSNAQTLFEVLFYDASNNLLGFGLTNGPLNEATSGGGSNWKQLTIPFGPGTSLSIPANTATVQLLAGVQSTNGTNSGVIAIGQIDCLATAIANQPQASSCYMTAGAAGKYPTPFCDQTQPGINHDKITGLYYRQFRLFGGFARTCEYSYTVEPECDIKVTSTDYSVILQESPVTLRVSQEADNLVIKAVCDYGANQGFLEGLDYTTYVQNISTVNQMLFNWRTARDVISEVANHTVASYYVDYHKFLHYTPALAVSAPFALSDHPDYVTTYPMVKWVYTDDSTQSETEPIVEGDTQLSGPQLATFNGTGAQTTFVLNGGNPVEQIDNITVNGASNYVVGLASVNTFAQGYNVLLDPTNGNLTFQTAPSSGTGNVLVTFRYTAPVIVRLHWPPATAKKHGKYYVRHLHRHHHTVTILVRRKIHKHHSQSHISSTQAAIDQANAYLDQYSKPQALSKATIYSPPSPTATTLRPGMAIAVTHALSDFSSFLLQVVEITIKPLGNGYLKRELGLGAYMPTFMIHQMHANRNTLTDSFDDGSTTINDVLSNSDGWALTDRVQGTLANVGKWGNPTTSVWTGTNVWG